MNLGEYFEKTKGRGILATADGKGRVNAAVYARPHFLSGKTVALIMGDRLSHKNLESNPHAVYLFIEEGEGYKGKRLYLRKVGEGKDSELIGLLRRQKAGAGHGKKSSGSRYLVFFRIGKVLPLIGAK